MSAALILHEDGIHLGLPETDKLPDVNRLGLVGSHHYHPSTSPGSAVKIRPRHRTSRPDIMGNLFIPPEQKPVPVPDSVANASSSAKPVLHVSHVGSGANSTSPAATPASTSKRTPHLKMNPLISILILRRMLLLTDGRDKVFKIIQYGLKTAMWMDIINAKRNTTLHAHAKQLIPHLSLTRKIIRTAYWLNSLNELVELSDAPLPASRRETIRHYAAVFNATVGFFNCIADDIVTAGKLGLVDKPLYNRATILADQLWFVTIFFDVYENMQTTAGLRQKLYSTKDVAKRDEIRSKLAMQRISLAKLGADFLFCSIDVFKLGDRGISDGWQAVSGLLSAFLGTYKVWVKNK
ncbi:hypothetical protein HDU85_000442 [Gaertneriomyces sp. JEL0708]|nr:hypothetical protein HDU85_000442 [Gaertneriomyces sp. JEL0708]